MMIEPVLFRLLKSGGRDRKTKKPQPLSAKTVRHIASVLDVILKKALKIKKHTITSNSMEGVEPPQVEPRAAVALDAERLCWYLDVAREYGLYEILLFASATAARRGEVLALTWPDLDLETCSVCISKSLEQTRAGWRLKTTKNKRTRNPTLPASVVEVLKFHRKQQDRNRLLFGGDYRTDVDLVFCDPSGEYLKPDSITAQACLAARKAGFKSVGIHTLRHSHGSELLSKGVPLPTVSKRLGHSSVHTTAKIYAHALPKDDITAAEMWDASIRAANGNEADGDFLSRTGCLHMFARARQRKA